MKLSLAIFFWLFLVPAGMAQHQWTKMPADTSENLHDIEFVNDSIGITYTYGSGKIYRTADGGFHWKLVYQTDSIYFEQVQFTNTGTGWVCGEKGSLLKSYDFGKTWIDISIRVKEGNLLLYGLCFLNDSIGYVSGGIRRGAEMLPKLYRTDDGGSSWLSVADNQLPFVLHLVRKQNALYGTGNGFILKIGLHDHSIKRVFTDTSGIVGQIRDLQFSRNGRLGIGVSFNGFILLTNNGGNSFSYQQITRNRLRSIANSGKNSWLAAGDNNKNDGAVLYTSNNNGKSWRKHHDFGDIHRIAVAAKIVWIAGKKGLIARRKKS